jgi:hypothetical protein
MSYHWSGMFSYTYSKLRGNYSGLTSTDMTDAGGGRNSPNNSRAFDEPYFQYDAYGKTSNGLLGTDRPNTFKGYAYYQLKEGRVATTNIGWFQVLYQGTPLSSYIDVGGSGGAYNVYPEGRGKWADITQDPVTGALNVTDVRTRRTPWFIQSDFNFLQEFKLSKNNEKHTLGLEATIGNLFNAHSALVYGSSIDAHSGGTYLAPGGRYLGGHAVDPHAIAHFYGAAETYYDWQTMLNTNNIVYGTNPRALPIMLNNQYGQPLANQSSRTIRLGVHYTF